VGIVKKSNSERTTASESAGRDIVPREQIPADIVKYLQEIDQLSVLSEGLSKDQLLKLSNVVKVYSMGAAATVIQTCNVNCTSFSRCPLAVIDRAPIGSICPIESQLYSQLLEDYKRAVAQKIASIESIKEIESDPIILSLISQAVEIDIFQLRVNAQIATAGLVVDVPVLASDDGIQYVLQETAASKMKRDLNARKDKVLRQLLATPEMVQKVKSLSKTNTITDQKRLAMDRANEILHSGEIELSDPDDDKETLKSI
jgi:hypothetical protein